MTEYHVRDHAAFICRGCGALAKIEESGSTTWRLHGVIISDICTNPWPSGKQEPPAPEMPQLQRDAVPMNRNMWKQIVEENKKLKEEASRALASGRCACIWLTPSLPTRSITDVTPCGAHARWMELCVDEQVKAFTEEHDSQCKNTGGKLEETERQLQIYREDVASLRAQLAASDRKIVEVSKGVETYRSWYEEALKRVTKYRRLLKRVILAHSAVQKVLDEE